VAMKAVASRTSVDVNASAGGKVGGVWFHVGANHFALDPRIERHVDQLALMRKGRIVDCDGDSAVHEVHKHGERDQNESDNQSENEAHTVL